MTKPLTDGPVNRPNRVRLIRAFCKLAFHGLFGITVEGQERFATGPAIYCFNHLNWTDPMLLLAVLPGRPKFAMFGPKEADMRVGARNWLIMWAGFGIPYRPEKSDMLETTRRVGQLLQDGWVILIAGEGRIHRGERELLPLMHGSAYFACRGGVPVIPIAVNGTSWLGFRRRLRVRVGEPQQPAARATREGVDDLGLRVSDALRSMVADFADPPPPGRLGRWLTELFNDWPEGARPSLGEGDAAGTDQAAG